MKEVKYVPESIRGEILFKLIQLSGYKLLVQGIQTKGEPNTYIWALLEESPKDSEELR